MYATECQFILHKLCAIDYAHTCLCWKAISCSYATPGILSKCGLRAFVRAQEQQEGIKVSLDVGPCVLQASIHMC